MRRYVLSPAAEEDIVAIFAWTEEQFGEQATLRYAALLFQAIKDIAEKHDRAGATPRPEIATSGWTYHLLHSRDRVAKSKGRVTRPRHFLLYRVTENAVEIARVLHDSVDFARHLPDEYRADSEN